MTETQVWITRHTRAKLEGLVSINGICTKKCKFAKFCYSDRHMQYRRYVKEKFALNSEILDNRLLKADEIAELNLHSETGCVRPFSFGNANTDICLENVHKIAYQRGTNDFGIWITPDNLLKSQRLKWSSNAKIIYSNKELDNAVAPFGGMSTFNIFTNKPKMDSERMRLEEMGVEVVICGQKCKECLACYKEPQRVVAVLEALK